MAFRLKGTFEAIDAASATVSIRQWVEVHAGGSFDNGDTEAEGATHLAAQDGRLVTRIGRGRYRFQLSGIELSSTDPDAP